MLRRRAPLVREPDIPLAGDPGRGAALRDLGEAGAPPWAPGAAPAPLWLGDPDHFGWLDDLAALGTGSARGVAQRWVADWLDRFGHGQGHGWTLPQAAARFHRLVVHGPWLQLGPHALRRSRLERAYARHLRYAAARLPALRGGAESLPVLRDLALATAALDEPGRMPALLAAALDARAGRLIDRDGGTASRCPELLADEFAALAEAGAALAAAGASVLSAHREALVRAAPSLRGLRHGDGALARFHGGDMGSCLRLDTALQSVRDLAPTVPRGPAQGPMGFVRLARGGTTVLVDAAPPPEGPGSHASMLAFEMTARRQPIVVNCGPGASFGPDWREAARSTPSHSTLTLDGLSSARLGPDDPAALPLEVETDVALDGADAVVKAAHNGYAGRFGLIHVRKLRLSLDGLSLAGQDLLTAVAGTARGAGVPFAIRLHLHPAVSADHTGGGGVRLSLPGGARWRFEADGPVSVSLDPSVYLENTRPRPEACQQIVLAGLTDATQTRIGWRLARETAPRSGLRPVPDPDAPEEEPA